MRVQNGLRRKRLSLFLNFIAPLKKPIRILDLGGTVAFWYLNGFANNSQIEIVVLNLAAQPTKFKNIKSIVGDARSLSRFKDKQYDVVFSNSLIEHIGDLKAQEKMGKEIMRIGKKYFVQTPNRFFVLEPHFFIPFFYLIPENLKFFVVKNLSLKWWLKPDKDSKIKSWIKSIRLLDEGEMKNIFKKGFVHREKFLGLTKSLISHN
jgi:ubiquinone/menaquinone biosynthesis C-methylase UbiE